jgi:hypothetical protein
MDDQWNLWVQAGIRHLVSLEAKPEPKSISEEQRYGSNGPWRPSIPVQVADVEPPFSGLPASWDMMDHDDDLSASGSDLLKTIGWDWNLGNQVAPNTPVRTFWALANTTSIMD